MKDKGIKYNDTIQFQYTLIYSEATLLEKNYTWYRYEIIEDYHAQSLTTRYRETVKGIVKDLYLTE